MKNSSLYSLFGCTHPRASVSHLFFLWLTNGCCCVLCLSWEWKWKGSDLPSSSPLSPVSLLLLLLYHCPSSWSWKIKIWGMLVIFWPSGTTRLRHRNKEGCVLEGEREQLVSVWCRSLHGNRWKDWDEIIVWFEIFSVLLTPLSSFSTCNSCLPHHPKLPFDEVWITLTLRLISTAVAVIKNAWSWCAIKKGLRFDVVGSKVSAWWSAEVHWVYLLTSTLSHMVLRVCCMFVVCVCEAVGWGGGPPDVRGWRGCMSHDEGGCG